MSNHLLDQPAQVRAGEQLDIPRLQEYLLKHLKNASGELAVEQFPGGASNLTYLLRLGEQQIVLRRPPFGAKIKSAHDMGREFKVLSALSQSYSKAPTPLHYTEDESIIGAPFYVMERIPGVILRSTKGPASTLPPETLNKIAVSLIDTLVELHELDYKAIGLGDLGKPEGYVARQVTGWTKRYFKAKTDEHPALEEVAQWLNDHIPTESGHTLIHNDFKHDNVILDPNDLTKVIAVLDWEMCTIGDPLMDVGAALAYWFGPNDPEFFSQIIPYPCSLPGNPSRTEFLQLYAKKRGIDVGNFVFYYVFGLFKNAVIVQQIYQRYKLGHTKDKRFASWNFMVGALGETGKQAIQKERIDDLF